jgi:serine/threonine protein kinase
MDKKPAKTIGKYELVAKIAQGGMGAVYKAKHPTLNRFVLLKKLTLRGGSQLVERFKREARIMMDIKHDHIVHVYDHFKEGSSYYIVEEFVDGISLDALLRRERYLSNEAAMLILYEVCSSTPTKRA